MAKKGLKGFVNRLVEGREKSEGYARASLPSNRWELFWDIFKGRFGKLVIINLLMLLFFLPTVLLFLFRYLSISAYGMSYPFGQAFGVGFMAPNSLIGMTEAIVFNVNSSIYLLFPIAMMIASIGLSGGAYIIRNLVWTEGTFVANDFWRGITKNYKKVFVITLMFSIIFYLTFSATALLEQMAVVGTIDVVLAVVLKVLAYFVFALFSIMTLHMITMTVTYDYGILALLKNSFLFTVGLIPQNVFFGFLVILPFLLAFLGGFLTILFIIVIGLFGLSYAMLIWTDFSQWAYDGFINEKIGAKKKRGIYEKVSDNSSKENLEKYKKQMEYARQSALSSRPIKPITDDELQLAELPTTFNRKDIEKLNASRQAIIEDNKRYVEEHSKQLEEKLYADKSKEELEKERQARIERAKRELLKRKKR
ncbi:MAG: hypothetical protein IKA12_02590 [Clostridia bacterium]|nr:hypothetical protein [Clostridia bacterium]